MPKILSEKQIAAFERDGYVFPVRAMSAADAQGFVDRLEAYEATTGAPIQSNMRHQVHLLFTWADELVRHAKVLDAVEDLIGPNIICYMTNFFIKEAQSPDFVAWHQDSIYWGLEPHDVVTAWIALSDAPVASGAMKFLAGSHEWDEIEHTDTFDEHNLLTRGQEMKLDAVDESKACDVPLKAGEISIHHVKLAHGSHPNTTPNRRIGLAVRYIPTHVRQVKVEGDVAVLVRGVDAYGHFDPVPSPVGDLDRAALDAHAFAMQRLLGAVYSGTDITEARP